MKHEEIYYICDRCGTRLKNNLGLIENRIDLFNKKVRVKNLKIDTKTAKPYSCIINSELHKVDEENSIYDMLIQVNYTTQNKRLDLCPDCREAFEKFMRNEV